MIALLIILLSLLLWNVGRMKKKGSPLPTVSQPSAAASSANPAAAVSTEKEKLAEEPEAREMTLEWNRDPFSLPLVEEGKGPTLNLKVSGIIYDGDHPEATYAIINEDLVRIGDDLHGIKVVDIQPNSVHLKKFNQEVTLYLRQEEKGE